MKKIVSTVTTGLAMAVMFTGTAFAWEYGLIGKGVCQPDGSYLITWTVDNTKESEALKIHSSSNTSVVPLGEVPANSKKDYPQTVDGTKAGTYTLKLTGNYKSDETMREESATVKLDSPCEQPGGRGSDTPVTPAVVSSTSVAPAVVPVGAVEAGDGGASSSSNMAALTALAASVVAMALGVIRRVQKS